MSNFYNRFLQSVERWPQAIAVELQSTQAGAQRHTYAQLRAMADSVAGWLEREGLAHGARGAILAANGPRWVAAYLGILACGSVAVPLDTAFNAQQVRKLLEDSGSSLLLVDLRHLPVAREAVQGLNVRLALLEGAQPGLPDLDSILAPASAAFLPAPVAPADTAVILYTSGTTSDPKGVMLTHANIAAEADAVFRVVHVGPDDAILGVLPLFHALAQMANLLLPLIAGARVVFLESLNTAELLRTLAEREITLFCCVPQFFYLIDERIRKEVGARGRLAESVFRALLRLSALGRRFGINLGKIFFRPVHRLLGSRLRYLITGGSRLDPDIGREFYALGFELLQAYGLTETSGGATATPPGRNVIGSVGPPLPGVELNILDAQKPGQEEGPAIGEIALRGGIVMKGYYNRPGATAQVLPDGWLHTGDLGYCDQHGNLFITGRAKEVIVLSSGKNVYPEEIEAHYQKSPYVREICVLGLQSRPGEPFSERLHAVVVPNFELLRERKIVNAREVIRFDLETLSQQLPASKRILSYEIWQEDLPRTTTRKLKRFAIEQRVREQQAAAQAPREGEIVSRPLTDEDRRWLAQPDVARALRVIRAQGKIEKPEIHPADNLELDLGLDSMERVELLVALERELGAHVEESVASQVYTVRELVEAVRQGAARGAPAARERTAWSSILNQEPTDPQVLAVARPHPVADRAWFLAGRLANLLARDFFHLQVSGLEKLSPRGPFILCPNHQSYLDPLVLVSCLPFSLLQDLFYVGTSEIFGGGLLRLLAHSIRLVPVDPDANLIPAMRAGAYGLRRGKILMLFPEGERSIDGRPRLFKKGAAILATHLHVPIYPVALDGFYEAWPRGKKFQGFTRLRIAFGDPVLPPREVGGDPEAAYEQLTSELKSRVMDMWLPLHQQLYPQPAAAD